MVKLIVLLAISFSLLGIGYHWMVLASKPMPRLYAQSRGSVRQGVLYAWGRGLLPVAKESTRRHPWVFWRGIALHMGVGAAFLILVSRLIAGGAMPAGFMKMLALLAAIGVIAALTAFIDRLLDGNLRALSNYYDDYLALMLVGVFLSLAAAEAVNLVSREWFYLAAALLLVYLPLGKLTHFIYWFYGRFYFGRKYGYRGVIPEARSGGGAGG